MSTPQIRAPSGKGKCWKCFQVEKWKRPCRRCGAKLCSKCAPPGRAMDSCVLCRNVNIGSEEGQHHRSPPQPSAATPLASPHLVYSPPRQEFPQNPSPSPVMHQQGAVPAALHQQEGYHVAVPTVGAQGGQWLSVEQHTGANQFSQLPDPYPMVRVPIRPPLGGGDSNLHHTGGQPGSAASPYQHQAPPPVAVTGHPGSQSVQHHPPAATQSDLVVSANQHHTAAGSQYVMGSELAVVETTVSVPSADPTGAHIGDTGKSWATELAPAYVQVGPEAQREGVSGASMAPQEIPKVGAAASGTSKIEQADAHGEGVGPSETVVATGEAIQAPAHELSSDSKELAALHAAPLDVTGEGMGLSINKHQGTAKVQGGTVESGMQASWGGATGLAKDRAYVQRDSGDMLTQVRQTTTSPLYQGELPPGKHPPKTDQQTPYGGHQGLVHPEPEVDQTEGGALGGRQGAASTTQHFLTEFRPGFGAAPQPEPSAVYPIQQNARTHPGSAMFEPHGSTHQQHPAAPAGYPAAAPAGYPAAAPAGYPAAAPAGYPAAAPAGYPAAAPAGYPAAAPAGYPAAAPEGYPAAATGSYGPVGSPQTVNRSTSARWHQDHIPSPSPPEGNIDAQWTPLAARLRALGKVPQQPEPHHETAVPGWVDVEGSRRVRSLSQPEVSPDVLGTLHRHATFPTPTHLHPLGGDRSVAEGPAEVEEEQVTYTGHSKVQERLRNIRARGHFSRALVLLQGAGADDFLEALTNILERLGFAVDTLHSQFRLTREQIVGKLEALTHGLIDGCQLFLCVFSEAERGVELSSDDIRDKLMKPSKARAHVVTHILIDGMRGMEMKYHLKKYRTVRGAELIGWWEDIKTPPHQRIMKKQPLRTSSTVVQICADRNITGYIPGSLIFAFIDVLNTKKYLSYTYLYDELEVAMGEAKKIPEDSAPSVVDQPASNSNKRSTREPISLTLAGIFLPLAGSAAKPVISHFLNSTSQQKKCDNDAMWRNGIVILSMEGMDGDEMAKFDWCA